MARLTGKNGRVKVGGTTVATITDWSVDAKVPTADATAMEDAFKEHLSLIREWSGSINGHFDNSAVNPFWTAYEAATTGGGAQSGKITVDLYPDANDTEKYSGDVFADISFKVGHDKVVDFSAKITGTGALTRTA